jgi:putative BNR repeat neuraminidase
MYTPVRMNWSRRAWMGCIPAGLTALRRAAVGAAPEASFLLSREGCGRASGYAEANKIVTWGNRTHVAWLDSPIEGFRVRVRTLDRRSGDWSPAVTVGEAHDNHGGPALTVDGQGYLHIVYYPHHQAMRHRQSKRPNDTSEWSAETLVGEKLTYPTLVCAKDGTLYLTCRRSHDDQPWQVELWMKAPGEAWQSKGPILAARYPGYSHFQESLAWGLDHRTLHLCCRFHEKSDGKAYGRLQTVAYLMSSDLGNTWRRSGGEAVTLPATAESADVLARGGAEFERVLRAGAMAVDSGGKPHLSYSVDEKDRGTLFVARPEAEERWGRIDLTQFLPAEWASWKLTNPGGVTFDGRGDMVVAAMVHRPGSGSGWGHPSSEVVQFRSTDGGATFVFSVLSDVDAAEAHWLPNIERTTGHNQVGPQPGVLYTSGGPGKGNRELMENGVYFVG